MQRRNNNIVIDLREEIQNSVKYVCKKEHLDMLLPFPTEESPDVPDLRGEFQSMFYDPATLHMDGSGKVVGEQINKSVWRMFYNGNDPARFLSRLGIDVLNPTVRDAVAFDLVKLDDDSVSNDSDYLYKEHLRYSPMEYERLLLNRNFRVNLVALSPEWSKINFLADEQDEIPDQSDESLNSSTGQLGENDEGYGGAASYEIKRSIESMYQGVHVSETILDFFVQLFDTAFDENGDLVEDVDAANSVYVPFTNSTDFTTEVSLVPNTRIDFKPITTRAYYDMKYGKYKMLLAEKGIHAISTFALVDPEKDKNHTGQYLVKVQKKLDDENYLYLVMKFDKDGQLVDSQVPFKSDKNTILCVCEDDFRADRTVPGQQEVWEPEIRDVPVVQSTTSSHYSVFRQRVPDYDLREVRHYLQFKNRLEGMELFLEMQKRDLWRKEVQASESFAKETMAIWWLFQEFGQNERLMQLVMEYYRLMSEWDDLIVKRAQLKFIKDEKKRHLDELLEQYASLDNTKLDKKLELGHKIKSVKMEIGKGIQTSIDEINEKLDRIRKRVDEINKEVFEIQNNKPVLTDESGIAICTELEKTFSPNPISKFSEVMESFIKAAEYAKSLVQEPQLVDSTISELLDNAVQQIQDNVQQFVDSSSGELWKTYYEFFPKEVKEPVARDDFDETKPVLRHIDTKTLHHFTIQTERWMGFFFNLGYELHQLKKIYTICEDQTIKVRRLVHNFKEKMEKTEADVWTENHELKPDFNFLSISSAGIYDIILLHDWYACNAPEKSYKDMGFKDDDEFMEFRKKCNKISYNLRKNQYAQMLAVQKTRLEDRINELHDLIQGETTLKYQDKYGKPAGDESRQELHFDPNKLFIFSDADLLLTELESEIPIDRSARQNVARTFNRLVQFVNADAELKELESQQKQTREVQVDWLFKKFKAFIDADSELGELEKNSNDQDQKPLVKKMFADFTAFIEAERLDFIKQNQGTGEEFDKIASFAMKKFKDFMQAESKIQKEEARSRQYRMDSETMVERTIAYLKGIGLIESPKDIEALATRSAVANNKVDSTVELNRIKLSKEALDQSIAKMTRQRNALQTIIDKIDEADKKVSALEDENKKLFNAAVLERNKQRKNRILMQRIENQNQIVELKGLAEKAKSSHLGEFRSLERLRNDVDRNRKSYDRYVSEFKEKIGLNKETVNQLMIGIYNRFQDEILNGAK